MSHPDLLQAWPYPRWIAHRGAGKLAPENTLAAVRLGQRYGYRMFECDVKLSSDGVPFLLHDSNLTRTTNATTCLEDKRGLVAGDHAWSTLATLDAGSWHSQDFAAEPLPTLDAVAEFCLDNDILVNIEIKPTPGTEGHTGAVVAHHVGRLWRNAPIKPLLTSFEVPALEAACAAQPELPRGLLLDAMRPDWLELAQQLGCQAVVCNYRLWNAHTVEQAKEAGLRTLSYTVNAPEVAQRLIAWGTDGIITDRVDLFTPTS
ncbi:MAG: glycerophosphodiester phosphodiesterase [Burkholderiales bacterium PBB4]|nr:MAG: glycerophosphodiester phosphodiesterase [Burkholderiales bacterium PBB4]